MSFACFLRLAREFARGAARLERLERAGGAAQLRGEESRASGRSAIQPCARSGEPTAAAERLHESVGRAVGARAATTDAPPPLPGGEVVRLREALRPLDLYESDLRADEGARDASQDASMCVLQEDVLRALASIAPPPLPPKVALELMREAREHVVGSGGCDADAEVGANFDTACAAYALLRARRNIGQGLQRR